MTDPQTTCPKCGNEMVYKINSAAKELECVHCPIEISQAVVPTPIHRAAWDLANSIGDYVNAGGAGSHIFDALMNFAEVINAKR